MWNSCCDVWASRKQITCTCHINTNCDIRGLAQSNWHSNVRTIKLWCSMNCKMCSSSCHKVFEWFSTSFQIVFKKVSQVLRRPLKKFTAFVSKWIHVVTFGQAVNKSPELLHIICDIDTNCDIRGLAQSNWNSNVGTIKFILNALQNVFNKLS